MTVECLLDRDRVWLSYVDENFNTHYMVSNNEDLKELISDVMDSNNCILFSTLPKPVQDVINLCLEGVEEIKFDKEVVDAFKKSSLLNYLVIQDGNINIDISILNNILIDI